MPFVKMRAKLVLSYGVWVSALSLTLKAPSFGKRGKKKLQCVEHVTEKVSRTWSIRASNHLATVIGSRKITWPNQSQWDTVYILGLWSKGVLSPSTWNRWRSQCRERLSESSRQIKENREMKRDRMPKSLIGPLDVAMPARHQLGFFLFVCF